MAAGYTVQTGSVALSASATKSLILLNPGSQDELKLAEFGVSFDAAAAAAGIRVELVRTTTLGSPAGTTGTLINRDPGDGTPAASALTALTTEPTTYEVLKGWFVQPFGGLLVLQYPLGREPVALKGGARLGLRCTTPSGVSPNADAYFEWEE